MCVLEGVRAGGFTIEMSDTEKSKAHNIFESNLMSTILEYLQYENWCFYTVFNIKLEWVMWVSREKNVDMIARQQFVIKL